MNLPTKIKAVPVDDGQRKVGDMLELYPRIMVEAAPGTGKTFTGVYLALRAHRSGLVSKTTPALFLTFSKNARVQIENEIRNYVRQGWMTKDQVAAIEVQNYHAFFFELLNKRGGVWGIPTPATPCSINERKQATKLAKIKKADVERMCEPLCGSNDTVSLEIRNKYRKMAIKSMRKGRPHYGDFAPLARHLLSFSSYTIKWLKTKYPLVILDEFQDSDCCQWDFLQKWSPERVVVFYDRYQTIHTWRNADMKRAEEVAEKWSIPALARTTLSTPHRSQTGMAAFFIDLRKDSLKGGALKPGKKQPFINFVTLDEGRYEGDLGPIRDKLRWEVIKEQEGTIAVICQYNTLSSFLKSSLCKKPSNGRGKYFSCKAISSDGPEEILRNYIYDLYMCEDGDGIRQWIAGVMNDLLLPGGYPNHDINAEFGKKTIKRNREPNGPWSRVSDLLKPFWGKLEVNCPESFTMTLTLLPDVAKLLAAGNSHPDYETIFYIRSIAKTAQAYGANVISDLVTPMENSLLQSGYLYIKKPPRGLFILNAFQAKGREFDHVIIPLLSGNGEPIHEGKNSKCVPYNFEEEEDRRLLYVAMTRAKKKITIMYPKGDPSLFLQKWGLL